MAGAVSSSLITYHVSETLHGHLHAANEDLRVRGLCERVPFIRQLPVFSFLVVFVHLLHQVLPIHKLVSWPKPFQSRLQVLHNHVRLKRRKRELRPGQTDSQVDASQRKFGKPELAYGLAMGDQTDSQIGSQVHASRKKSLISRIYS